MSWHLTWIEEIEEDGTLEHEHWATSWEEVVGYFTSWMSKASNVIKGEVMCYWGEKPYGNKPCLEMNIYAEETDEE